MDSLIEALEHMRICEDIAESIGLFGMRNFTLAKYAPEDVEFIKEMLKEDYHMRVDIEITEVEE